ncbi:MAG: MMPL family transporter [Deltaproteobacteria bacterium]|nr:MMPL family transporter [Deltaproteobacteria bacterium]MBW2414392.1 MMPL family transporter [Deltaproteobacteria bacterium]
MISLEVFAAGAVLAIGAGVAFASLRPAWIVDHPRTVLFVLAAITLGVLAILVRVDPPGLRLGVDASSEPLLPQFDEAQAIYRQASLDFGSDDVYVIAMETPDIFRYEELSALRDISDRISALHGVRGVESVVDAYAFRYDPEEQWLNLGRFVKEIPKDPAELLSLREQALSNPIYTKTILSADGRTAALNVTFQTMTDGEFVDRDLDGRIRRILDDHASDARRFYTTGRPHIRSEAHHLMIRDMLVLIPIAVVVAAFLLWLMTGSLRGTFVPLISNLTSTFWTFGAMVVVGRELTVITLALGPMLICIGAVYGVHVLARYEEIARAAGDPRSAALDMLVYTRAPVLMAGLTTMVGFAALTLADVQAVREMGGFAVFGVATVTLLSLTGVPAALSLMPLQRGDRELFGPQTRLSTAFREFLAGRLRSIAWLCTTFPTSVLVFWAVAATGAVVLIPRIVIDTDYLMFFLEDSPVRTDFAAVNRLLAGAVPIYVPVHGGVEGAFRDPEGLAAVERIQNELSRTEGVSQVLSAVDLVRLANRGLYDDDPAYERIPDNRPELAEIFFLIPKETLRRFTNSNQSKANLIVRTSKLGSAPIRALEDRIHEAIRRADIPDNLQTYVTGNAILINRSADGIAGNQGLQVGLAAFTIFLLVTGVFRSLRLGLIAMAPNIVPVLLFFGTLGAGVATLSIATSLIACIALGIAVDSTVHFLVSYRRVRQSTGATPEEAVKDVIRVIGRPIATTSIMLVLGFMVITVSGFATLREFGYLTGTTMAICMCTDLGLLPALVTRLRA